MSHHHEDKKDKKKAQIKKNRRTQELFRAFQIMRETGERIKDEAEARLPKSPAPQEEAWGDKVSSIRNRLTDKRRMSKERWNRFAGTGGEGGRGL